jgi:hypothetical protein
MKKVVRHTFFPLSAFAFLLPSLVFAQAKLSVSGNLPGMAPITAGSNPGSWVNGFYSLALMLGGVLAFGAVVYGGVLYASSAGNPSRQGEGKEWIWAALTGLALLAGAWLVLNAINPDLTNVAFPGISSVSAVNTQSSGTASCGPDGFGACASGQNCVCATNQGCSCQASVALTCSGSTKGTCPIGRTCDAFMTLQGNPAVQVVNYQSVRINS